ncbi:MAG: HAMP domain-containing histidine kinase [Synechococcales cyanobacterium C42_A2020_086]|nr:HAMP domain-containing histidine kinase [Synechococcales cyanobacterium M58_A2018_015]MBF2073850.1 HAMP domain-containing histidine kinase [Synechococcales cyanobacterium C42_A2020_086]
MQDFSQLLDHKVTTIAQQWVDAVLADRRITSADRLSRSAIEDHIDQVLAALVSVLSHTQASDIDTIAKASLIHGTLRANQGFDAAEIAQEYHLLRTIILANLRTDLLHGSTEEVFRAISVVNAVIDAALSQCFKSYVEERTHELEQVQHQLSMTVQELNRLVQASQDNLSLLAHELKTPLTSIIGYSELYLRQYRQAETKDNKDSVPRLEHIERVLRKGRELLRLINDALEISRYEAGRMIAQPTTVEVEAAMNAVIEVMQPLADSRGLQLILKTSAAPQQVWTDPLRLQQIMINLVSNAVRYTETGSIIIECRQLSNPEWLISITDTGIGIAPEDQLSIFDAFAQAAPANHPRPENSTGLGLAIVTRLVELLQGRIYLASQVGAGSTFTVILPLRLQEKNE